MKGPNELLVLLREGNPIPDAARRYQDSDDARDLFLLIEERRHEMRAPSDLATRPAPLPHDQMRRRSVLAFAGAGVVVLAVIVLGAVLILGGGEQAAEPAPTSSSPTVSPTSVPTPTTSPSSTVPETTLPSTTMPPTTVPSGSLAGRWTQLVSLEEAFGADTRVNGLARHGNQLVAVGEACDESGCVPMSWTSQDGITWNPRQIDDTGTANQIVSGPAGLVVTCEEHDQCNVAAWHSPDGTNWLPTTFEGCDTGATSSPCALGEDVRLIGGNAGYALSGLGASRWIIWTSRDGAVWRLGDIGSPEGAWSLDDRFATIVGTCDEESICSRQLWTSDDGITWVERYDEAINRLSIPQRPVSWHGGALIFGYQPDNDGIFETAVWTSNDGLTWKVQPLAEPSPSGNGIVPFSGGLFSASGGTDEFGNTGPGFTWTSVDGRSWKVHEWAPDEFPAPGEAGDTLPATSYGDGVLVATDAIWFWNPGS